MSTRGFGRVRVRWLPGLLLLSLLGAGTGRQERATSTAGYEASHRYEKLQRYAEAIRALAGVHKATPQDYTVNLRLGWLYYRQGAYANSLGHYAAAVRAAPGAVEPLLGRSLPLLAQQRWADAERLLLGVVAIDPCNYYGNLRLEYVLREQRKWTAAAKVNRRMLGLYPCDTGFLAGLAAARAGAGAKKEAAVLYRRLLKLDPVHQGAVGFLKKG